MLFSSELKLILTKLRNIMIGIRKKFDFNSQKMSFTCYHKNIEKNMYGASNLLFTTSAILDFFLHPHLSRYLQIICD